LLTRPQSYVACGDGDGCGFLDRLRPGGVLPALLVGEVLGLGAGDEGTAECDGDAGEVGDPGGWLPPAAPGACCPDALWPAPPSGPAWPGLAIGARNTLNGVSGPPNNPMPARIRAPTSRTLAPAPSMRIKRRRWPEGSAKTGSVSCPRAALDGGMPCDWVTRRV
jgi:hypothetical protein